ncbi:MAG TPA: ABC transporter substrate-binding protein [Archangium sp.]|uniref:MlaC/ttg2D family ABC transporter substrate-binding protein n=1 Tax=Archangium sp. TaxID=1872627 RepID=UPI002E37E0BA|nr:ABC transporter substrate-binding protein [Archangium sp.]HEX5753539.1 ABC transporter substrate-binding protein [Archangium sp.]
MFASLLAAVLLTAAPAPLDVVKSGNTEVQKIITAKGGTAEQLSKTVDRFVDWGELSKRALGETWDKLTPAQRTDFSETMQGLLRASYAQRALSQGRALVQYGQQSIQGNEATVGTKVIMSRDRLPVQYKLFRAAGKDEWRIYDIVTDDISLLETYQGQFRKIMADKGFNGLLTTLKAKRAQLEKSLE